MPSTVGYEMPPGWMLTEAASTNFPHAVAAHLRDRAENARTLGTVNSGVALETLASFVQTLGPFDAQIFALERLSATKTMAPYEPGSEASKVISRLGSMVQPPSESKDSLAQIVAASIQDFSKGLHRDAATAREEAHTIAGRLEKKSRRVDQLEGVESSLMKAKARIAEVEQENEQQAKLIAHLRALVPEQDEVHA